MSIGSYARFQGTPPHESEGSASTWWHRAANTITAYSEVITGSVLHRADNADEYFLWALPMLPQQPKSYARVATVYAAGDPRAALNRRPT